MGQKSIVYELPERGTPLDAIPTDWDDLEGRLRHPGVYNNEQEAPVDSELEVRLGHERARLEIETETEVGAVWRLKGGIEPRYVEVSNWGALSEEDFKEGRRLLGYLIGKDYEGYVESRRTHNSSSSPSFYMLNVEGQEKIRLSFYERDEIGDIVSDLEDMGVKEIKPRQVA